MSTYEPGWYLATVDGAPDQRVTRTVEGRWLIADGQQGVVHSPSPDFRPAIVLDPNDMDVQRFVKEYSTGVESKYCVESVANQIDAQMPEPKPERIKEPGRLGVVQSETILHAARYFMNLHGSWYAVTNAGGGRPWTDLIDPVLVHPGEGDVP